MARSLQVQPEETVRTSPLLLGFVLLAAIFLMGGAFATAASDAAEVQASAR